MFTVDFDSCLPRFRRLYNIRQDGKLNPLPLVVSVHPQLNHPLTGIGLNNKSIWLNE